MQSKRQSNRRGFTLLEVILALGLTVIVIGLVGSAIFTTLKMVDQGREKTERGQLARAILAHIANDLRSTVRYEPFDPAGMMPMSSGKSSSKGGGSSSGGSSSGSSSSGSGSGGGGSSSSGADSTTPDSSTTTDDAASSAAAPASYPGIIGYPDALQVDSGRLPRIDEYVSISTGASTTPTSDVRTVSYYLAGSTSQLAALSTLGSSVGGGTGLVRGELSRAASQWALVQGGQATEGSETVIAPEVAALEFLYFDGASWLTTWDTASYSGLPKAIKISIVLTDPANSAQQPDLAAPYITVADALVQDPASVFSVVVRLPASAPFTVPSGSATSSSSGSSSSSSSGSSSSGSSGTSGQQPSS